MPNHFHLVVEPAHPSALSQFMQWLLTSHVRRYHNHYGTSGHVWQGRFKSFPVQRDEHLITVLRYVLQNPVRAGLSGTAREWLWSSLRRPGVIDPCPVSDEHQLSEPIKEDQLAVVRECLNRQRPFGKADWQAEMARRFGFASAFRPRGRPRSEKKSSLSCPGFNGQLIKHPRWSSHTSSVFGKLAIDAVAGDCKTTRCTQRCLLVPGLV